MKLLNAGQTCIAPDYVLVHGSIQADFLAECKTALQEFYGDDSKTKDLGRIINVRHFNRIKKLMETSGGEVYHHGGEEVRVKDRPSSPWSPPPWTFCSCCSRK